MEEGSPHSLLDFHNRDPPNVWSFTNKCDKRHLRKGRSRRSRKPMVAGLHTIALTMIIASLPIGKIVDKFGRKIPLITGLIIFGIATLIFMWGNLPMLMLSMVLFAIGHCLQCHPPLPSLQTSSTPKTEEKLWLQKLRQLRSFRLGHAVGQLPICKHPPSASLLHSFGNNHPSTFNSGFPRSRA